MAFARDTFSSKLSCQGPLTSMVPQFAALRRAMSVVQRSRNRRSVKQNFLLLPAPMYSKPACMHATSQDWCMRGRRYCIYNEKMQLPLLFDLKTAVAKDLSLPRWQVVDAQVRVQQCYSQRRRLPEFQCCFSSQMHRLMLPRLETKHWHKLHFAATCFMWVLEYCILTESAA